MIKNQWYAIISSNKVKKSKLLGIKRLGIELCLFRDSLGNIACVSNKCPHRGAALCKGKQKCDSVVCPFHGFEFNSHGRCTLIPANGKNAVIENKFNVTSYLVREENDIIYMWYGDKQKATTTLPFFNESIDNSYVYSEISDKWNSHYSRCIENQLDVIHIPFVHHNTIGRGNKTLVNGPALELKDNKIIMTAINTIDNGTSPKSSIDCNINPNMNLQFIFPNIWQNYISKNIKAVIFFAPVDDENTILYIRFYTNLFKLKFMNKIMAQLGKHANKIIERQDKPFVETQLPKKSSLHCKENLINGDRPIILYRKIRNELQNKD